MSPLLRVGIPLLLVLGATALVYAWPSPPPPPDDPWAHVAKPPAHLDHAPFYTAPLADGPAVTKTCLSCHPESAKEVMATSHWTWTGDEVHRPGAEPLRIGKANLFNNFCIAVTPNQPFCTSCHAGYGWKDKDFDFDEPTNVDCLVCHDQSGGYAKKPGGAGYPADGVDLLAAAKSVGRPNRSNCGACHFDGGGGDGVKHGDLDRTMLNPPPRIDVHMGKYNLTCVDCHKTHDHEITGRSMSVSVNDENRVFCTDCHSDRPHGEERLDSHTDAVACPTCHIPYMAVQTPTKLSWDWSTAGQDIGDDLHHYLKKKGTFHYAANVPPEYAWYNGLSKRHLPGDNIDPDKVTELNSPAGSLADPTAKIWPFKVHRGKQVYDVQNLYFLAPKTAGEGGYWTEFEWDKALRLGAEATGLAYSGEFGFAPTKMYWPLAHMIPPAAEALTCVDCHAEGGRMDWEALGYGSDPIRSGGRNTLRSVGTKREAGEQ
ncbi:MAG: tetrathionate reductase family octaheme c-type cytochrome [Deltaproteobacteria bacterium]|nr:tetrathionate reductase family octaheme c-type cytochrome [Deltaproteobacteria bacterium]